MTVTPSGLQATALCLALLWLALALRSRTRRALTIVWALFCGSIAMSMARGLVGPEAGGWYVLFGVGACFTCNGFWLVARALFRPGPPFAAPHVAYVGVVAVLIILSQTGTDATIDQVVGKLLGLLSSVNLVMAFWEGLRGWSGQRGVERAMRAVFLATYGGCVAIALLLPIMLGNVTNVGAMSAAAAAATIVLVTQTLVAWRLRHPLDQGVKAAPAAGVPGAMASTQTNAPDTLAGGESSSAVTSDAAIRVEDAALARALDLHMRSQQRFLQPELKLNHLAQALDVSEYRISRAIHDVLGHRNISQYVNSFRLEHAQALLANPTCDDWSTLVIALESGFGSLGPFHRAFKAATGYPPGEFRAMRQASIGTRSACAGGGVT